MTSNLRHWEALFRTNPEFTKPFTSPGGFRGTATDPIFHYLMLTEHFGPMGQGWGTYEPKWQIVNCADQGIIVFCTLECWYIDDDSEKCSLWGVGGDRVVKIDSRGIFPDDDAFKKAFTDALGNAFSRLGLGGDIRMKLFNDVKYLADTKDMFRSKDNLGLPKP